jgi:hypothetical protein
MWDNIYDSVRSSNSDYPEAGPYGLYVSMYLCIHVSMYLSIYQYVDPLIYLSIYLSICLFSMFTDDGGSPGTFCPAPFAMIFSLIYYAVVMNQTQAQTQTPDSEPEPEPIKLPFFDMGGSNGTPVLVHRWAHPPLQCFVFTLLIV